MKQYIETAKTYIETNKKELIVGSSVIVGGVILIIAIAIFINNSTPKIVYQPAKACELLTLDEAKTLLGSKTINSNSADPVVSKSGTNAVSNCGYTDGSADADNILVAAINVRSAVNDEGVKLNKTDFVAASRASQDIETVKGLGESAFFNHTLGQLNILDGRKWIILNYGVGSAPEANALDKALELGRVVLGDGSKDL